MLKLMMFGETRIGIESKFNVLRSDSRQLLDVSQVTDLTMNVLKSLPNLEEEAL